MTTMGPPHLGHNQLGVGSWAVDIAASVLHCCGIECGEAQGQKLSSLATGEETEVTDADEALGEQMQEEAAQKLIER
jgi:hypothetical protein